MSLFRRERLLGREQKLLQPVRGVLGRCAPDRRQVLDLDGEVGLRALVHPLNTILLASALIFVDIFHVVRKRTIRIVRFLPRKDAKKSVNKEGARCEKDSQGVTHDGKSYTRRLPAPPFRR